MNPIRKTIGYADESWNPVTGCRHGCTYCYARRTAEKLQKLATAGDDCTQPGGGLHEIRYKRGTAADSYRYGFEPTLHSHRLREPRIRRKPEVIFACDMGDLFGAWVPAEWIRTVLDVVKECPRHRFLLLTKNPARYAEFDLPPNAWAGTTVTGPGDAGRLQILDHLAANRHLNAWVSYEPALGPYPSPGLWAGGSIRWITIGAQTGPGATPPDLLWIDELVRATRRVNRGAAVFMKSNLAWPGPRPREYPEGLVVG